MKAERCRWNREKLVPTDWAEVEEPAKLPKSFQRGRGEHDAVAPGGKDETPGTTLWVWV
jgi:hypothetical protein